MMEVSPYKTEYRKGKLNGAADALSRLLPQNKDDENNQVNGAIALEKIRVPRLREISTAGRG